MSTPSIVGESDFSENNGTIAVIDTRLADTCCTEEWYAAHYIQAESSKVDGCKKVFCI